MTAVSAARIATIAGLVLLTACGHEPTPPAPVASILVSPDTGGVVLGQTLQLTARARDAQGHDLTDRPVTWSSSAPTLASVSPTGLVTAVALGDGIVIIATSEGITGNATLAVVIDLAGEWNFTEQITANTENGVRQPVTMTCSDTGSFRFSQDGATIGATKANVGTCIGPQVSRDNTRMGPFSMMDARLTSSHISLGFGPDCGWEGGVTGPPAPKLRGTYFCPNESGSWEAIPGGAPVTSVAVRWGARTVVGGTVQLAAVPRDAAGHILSRVVTWSSDNPGVAAVSDSGLVTLLTAGSARVTASSEGMSGSGAVTVDAVNFSFMTGGGRHSCGTTVAGAAYCWGSSGDGQLGNGFRPIGSPPRLAPLAAAETPLAVAGGHYFTEVSAGLFHSCGMTLSGEVYCWGDNAVGQLGDGTTTNSLVPVRILGGHQFADVAVGIFHSCGVTTGNDVYCWGGNTVGQLGNGSQSSSSSPVRVAADVLFVTVRAGAYHNCAITAANEAYCWGFNDFGQVGNGETALAVTAPVAVVGGGSFVAVGGGYAHSCALSSDGTAYCWGNNQLAPVPVSAGPFTPSVAALAVGGAHTCALTPAGTAYCWGYNILGQLGDGSTTDRSTPVPVSGGFSFTAISAGSYHTCGVTTGIVALCWGDNANGQLGADAPQSCVVDGNGTTLPCAMAPVPVIGQPGAAAARSLWVDAGNGALAPGPSALQRSAGPGQLPLAPSVRGPRRHGSAP